MRLPPEISKCLCDTSKCKERGKVCWEADGGQYLHVRVDGCLGHLADLKKADCVIVRLARDKVYAYVIEVKSRRYDLDEVREKMENTLNALYDILRCAIVPIPVLYAESHERWVVRYALHKKVRYKGRAYPITFLKYCQSLQKAVEAIKALDMK